ncbi:MAG: hypothetical protein WC509_04350 [Candidatus Izemoplasmatales bacterium]
MGRALSKFQKKERSRQHKAAIKERLDAAGISRRKFRLVISPKAFFVMKGVGILLIPIAYFVYSPLLALVMAYFVALFFAAIGCEHALNKSVIRSNHVKIPKADSAVALLLLSASLFASASGIRSGGVGRFANTLSRKIASALTDFGSLQTGMRTVFSAVRDFRFGAMERPEGFIPNKEAFMDRIGSMPPGGMPGGIPDFEVSIDAIPIEFMFSQVFSTVATVLIAIVAVLAAASLFTTVRKIRRFEQDQSETIVDGEIRMLSDEELAHVFAFGEITETCEP